MATTAPQKIEALQVPGMWLEEPKDKGVKRIASELVYFVQCFVVKLIAFFVILTLASAWVVALMLWDYKVVGALSFLFLKFSFVLIPLVLSGAGFFVGVAWRTLIYLWHLSDLDVSLAHTAFLGHVLHWCYSLTPVPGLPVSQVVPVSYFKAFDLAGKFVYQVFALPTRLAYRMYASRGKTIPNPVISFPAILRNVPAHVRTELVDEERTMQENLTRMQAQIGEHAVILVRLWDDVDGPLVPAGDGELVVPSCELQPIFRAALIFARVMSLCRLSTVDLVVFVGMSLFWFAGTVCLWILRFSAERLRDLVRVLGWAFGLIFLLYITPGPVVEAFCRVWWQVLGYPFFALAKRYLLHPSFVIMDSRIVVNAGVMFAMSLYRRYKSTRSPLKQKARLSARFNSAWVAAQRVVAQVNLPSFVRTQLPFTYSGIAQSFETMKALGWPVNVEVTQFVDNEYTTNFPGWGLASIDFKQGMQKLVTFVDEELAEFEKDSTIEYIRSESYQSLAAEMAATSRYFKNPDYHFVALESDEVYELVADIFGNSFLTPFAYIIKKWEKKYGLGPFAKVVTPSGHERKLKRKEFIDRVGWKGFVDLWAKTFELAPSLVPVAPVSVKREALPPKKWLAGKVRTVIGAPITHYISSTIFNYAPNHNFKWLTTPIKVGMPLNGDGMSSVWSRHSMKDVHYAGDCSEFDSTLSGEVLRIIKEVRKKGFENHKDYDRICQLIDREYANISRQPLAHTSTGHVFAKGTGLTTGHSSTSMDNSLGMVTLYFMAWKELTGLSARDFKHYVELSVYGDDHLISWRADAPPSWTFPNIQATMARWGITNNEEGSGDLQRLEFLSKFGRRTTAADVEELSQAGLAAPDWIIFHNRDKLVGKIKAPNTRKDMLYSVTRLKSYLTLTAHHREIYDQLVSIIKRKVELIRVTRPSFQLTIPKYNDILRAWYAKKDSPYGFDPAEDVFGGEIDDKAQALVYGEVTFVDAIVNVLSSVVDIVNPDVYNSGIGNFVLRPLKPYHLWAVRFTREANFANTERHTSQLLQKGAYDWISNEVEVPTGEDPSTATSRLIKHWLYMSMRNPAGGIIWSKTLVWFDKKLADVKYLIFGHIDLAIRRLDVPWWNALLCAALGAIPDIEGLPDYRSGALRPFLAFSAGAFSDSTFSMLVNYVFASVPVNFQSAVAGLRAVQGGSRVVIQAGTGSGKTTTMAKVLCDAWPGRVVYVEPRRLIVQGVTPYMAKKFDITVTGYTEGMRGDPQAKLVYMTAMEVMLHPEFLTPDTLYVLDECHVAEPLYLYARQFLEAKAVNLMYTSATPPADLVQSCLVFRLKAANVWRVDEFSMTEILDDPAYHSASVMQRNAKGYRDSFIAYQTFLVTFVRNCNPFAKTLIFVNTKQEGDMVVQLLTGSMTLGGRPARPIFIHSGATDIPDDVNVIVTTSVSDVGVTIPDVDHVITTDTILEVRASIKESKVAPYLSKAPQSVLTQRKGRTGRTNNGRFILWTVPGVEGYEPLSPYGIVVGILSSGVLLGDLAAVWPDLIRKAVGPGCPDDITPLVQSWATLQRFCLDYYREWESQGVSIPNPYGSDTVALSIDGDARVVPAHSGMVPLWYKSGVAPGRTWSLANELASMVAATFLGFSKGITLEVDTEVSSDGHIQLSQEHALLLKIIDDRVNSTIAEDEEANAEALKSTLSKAEKAARLLNAAQVKAAALTREGIELGLQREEQQVGGRDFFGWSGMVDDEATVKAFKGWLASNPKSKAKWTRALGLLTTSDTGELIIPGPARKIANGVFNTFMDWYDEQEDD